MIEVQECGLGTFEQHALACMQRLVEPPHGVSHQRRQPRRNLGDELIGQLGIDARMFVHPLQIGVAVGQHAQQPGAQRHRLEQILDAQSDSCRLVGVRRPDAALGGAELRIAALRLGELVGDLVVRQHEMRRRAEHQPAAVDTPALQHVDLVDQHPRVDHDAIADDRRHVLVQHPAGNELQSECLAVDDDSVPRVVAALIADDVLAFLCDDIDDAALALIAPLHSYDDRAGHDSADRQPAGCLGRHQISLGRDPFGTAGFPVMRPDGRPLTRLLRAAQSRRTAWVRCAPSAASY